MKSFSIKTNYPVALESYDYLYPFGTIRDNHSNTALVQKLKNMGVSTLLDIGCAGGGFVEELLQNGINAVGIEGSDTNLRIQRAAWAMIPNNLFTVDATKPFSIKFDSKSVIFNVVTAWEFFEHIEEKDLPQVMENIKEHTAYGSQLICSIANFPSPHEGIDLHRTQKELPFWIDLFESNKFQRDADAEKHYEGNWVRNSTFNLVLRRRIL